MNTQAAPQTEALLAHADWIERLAARLVTDAARADDVVQEAWLEVLQHPPSHSRNLRSWMAGVVFNAARKSGRSEKRRRRREAEAARPEAQPSTADIVERATVQREVVGDVLALDEKSREIVLLRYFEGLAPREIAKRTGRPVNTVRTQLQRALEKLGHRLEGRYGDRRQWAVALIPLARRGTEIAGAASAIVPVLSGAALVVAVIAGWKWLAANDPRQEVGVVEVQTQSPKIARDEDVGDGEETDTREPRTEAAPDTALEATVASGPTEFDLVDLEGRVIDLEGLPLSGVELTWKSNQWPDLKNLPDVQVRQLRPDEAAKARVLTGAEKYEYPQLVRAALAGELPELAPGRSDSSGFFKLRVPPMEGRVECTSEGHILLAKGQREGSPETVYLVARAGRVDGIVVDDLGDPIEGADVGSEFSLNELPFLLSSDTGFRSWTQTSDSEGRFHFDTLPLRYAGSISATRLGYRWARTELPAPGSASQVRLEMKRKENRTWITGIVVDGGGNPVDEADVFFGQDRDSTDADGRFRFEVSSLRAGAPLIAWKKGHRAAQVIDLATRVRADRSAGEDLRLLLEGEPLEIRGVVIDEDGKPASHWRVGLEDGTPFGSMDRYLEMWRMQNHEGYVTADAEGHFALQELGDRSYRLYAFDVERMLKVVTDPIPAGTLDVRIEISKDDVIPRMRCQVVTRGGTPVSGAEVSIEVVRFHGLGQTSFFTERFQTADESGYVEFEDVPRQNASFSVRGEGLKMERTPISDNMDTTLVVAMECELQVTLESPGSADAFELYDETGDELSVVELRPTAISYVVRGTFREGKSYRCRTTNFADEIVFYKNDVEVGRTKLHLEPGIINPVVW